MLHLRPATPQDIPLLQHWSAQPHVAAATGGEEWDWETDLGTHHPWREQLIAELRDRPIAFVQIIDPAREESHYWGQVADHHRAIDLWIGKAEDLGRGYGTLIMEEVIARCFRDLKVVGILVDPLVTNTAAIRFYRRLGFVFLEERELGGDPCAVHLLSREGAAGQNFR
ncbi:aminoglycoside 6'-N-acetyltransferase [Lewinella marina]|uniref:GNAT family N-acetyltransferase n=1 Tax=Neolewinella marina TaxID=438751 RepID=A0A2G0CEH7_9BACT|nr:GNAT family N-acetyltransferase [Neolewinella marina]NJB87300.1 aminoglycoside 6'-N-acetyltransferase [Neolewinella marina]PHK98379.1 GNAT family N-acetyltransferase [Neolewinella marina]